MSRREALAALARRYPEDYQRILAAIKRGEAIGEITVAEWLETWMGMRHNRVRPGTWVADRSSTRWINRAIGPKRLAALQPSDARAPYQLALSGGLAPTTAERVWSVTKLMLRDADEEGHEIPERTLRARMHGVTATVNRQAIPIDDAKKILAVAMKRPDASRWVAALLQGTRPAEALGLRWENVDLEAGTMRIEWQLKRIPYIERGNPDAGFRMPPAYECIHLADAFHLVRPKTASGIRTVPLVPWLQTELVTWAAITPVSPHSLVWPHPDGGPKASEIDRADWYQIVDQAGVTLARPDGSRRRPLLYEARHTAATLLMAHGTDEKTLTAIVGHSKITSTKAYLHTDETRKRAALENVSTTLGLTP